MYQDKASRKRRGVREPSRHDLIASSAFPNLTDSDIQRAAAGIL
jgi:hypothetical protein